MKKVILIISLFSLTIIGCLGQNTDYDMLMIDSIKAELDIHDSIQFIKSNYTNKGTTHEYQFIDYNLKSSFHEKLTRRMENMNKELKNFYLNPPFKSSKKVDKSNSKIDSQVLEKLNGNWIPLYTYKGQHVVYLSCDYQVPGYTITDSTFVNYNMEGPIPSKLSKAVIIDNEYILTSFHDKSYRLKLIDPNRSIYAFEFDKYSPDLLIPLTKVNQFPVFVQHCHATGASRVEFDDFIDN